MGEEEFPEGKLPLDSKSSAFEDAELERTEPEDVQSILQAIDKTHPDLFEGISPEKKQQFGKILSLSSEIRHSGPLPAVETLEGYNRIIPNGGERIMIQAEKEQNWRHDQTRYVAKREFNQQGRGQIFGFILALIGICGGIFLTYIGKDTTGIAIIFTAAATVAGPFIYSKYVEAKKNSQKEHDS